MPKPIGRFQTPKNHAIFVMGSNRCSFHCTRLLVAHPGPPWLPLARLCFAAPRRQWLLFSTHVQSFAQVAGAQQATQERGIRGCACHCAFGSRVVALCGDAKRPATALVGALHLNVNDVRSQGCVCHQPSLHLQQAHTHTQLMSRNMFNMHTEGVPRAEKEWRELQ